MRNPDENGVQQSQGMEPWSLRFLIHERHVKAVGHETFDTDAGIQRQSMTVNEHYLLPDEISTKLKSSQLDQVQL